VPISFSAVSMWGTATNWIDRKSGGRSEIDEEDVSKSVTVRRLI
jgi:hypothetical protein